MRLSAEFFDQARRRGRLLHARVLTRDNLHLGPALVSQAAAGRLRQGLRALEAYLRRLLILLALHLEPGLAPDSTRVNQFAHAHAPRAQSTGLSPSLSCALRIFTGEFDRKDWPVAGPGDRFPVAGIGSHARLVAAQPLLARLAALKALIDTPDRRARRLAFHMARARPGPVLAPTSGGLGVPQRYGTEASALYASFGIAITEISRARPPPLGPMARPGPRIRSL